MPLAISSATFPIVGAISLDTVQKIANALGIDAKELFNKLD